MFTSEAQLKDRIAEVCGRKVDGHLDIFEDTTCYAAIYGGSVLRLQDHEYFVRGEMTEGRFGIDDQPKFWVKHAIDLATGAPKIIKMVFHEQFSTSVAGIRIRCQRSADKESAVLALCKGRDRFMQGKTTVDHLGTPVRVIDFIRGRSLYSHINDLEMAHEDYYVQVLPGMMAEVVHCIDALQTLHDLGQHHGDVRNDHIFIDSDTGKYRWIDFDYHVNFADYDIWCMGNVINFVVGMGTNTFHWLRRYPESYPGCRSDINGEDAMTLGRNRIANLKSLFPYVSESLNEILMRFAVNAGHPYESLKDLANDLRGVFDLPANESHDPTTGLLTPA